MCRENTALISQGLDSRVNLRMLQSLDRESRILVGGYGSDSTNTKQKICHLAH